MTPSSRAASLTLSYLDGQTEESIPIEDGDEIIGIAGETISGLSEFWSLDDCSQIGNAPFCAFVKSHQVQVPHWNFAGFVLYDEAGREKDPSDIPASKFKVNWTQKAGKDIALGKLPDIKVNWMKNFILAKSCMAQNSAENQG